MQVSVQTQLVIGNAVNIIQFAYLILLFLIGIPMIVWFIVSLISWFIVFLTNVFN